MISKLDKLFKPVVASLAGLGNSFLLYQLWQRPIFNFQEPQFWVVAASLLGAALLFFRVPLLLWLWWLAGAATLTWSVAPGNTLISSLWEVLLLAAFGAAFWRPGFWLVSVLLLAYGLERSLILNFFGLQSYLSGSIHYMAGAQALALVPLAFAFMFRTKPLWQRGLFALLLLASTYLAMISGARAVYLPLALIVALLVGRLILSGKRWFPVLGAVAVLAVSLVALDYALPTQPMMMAIGRKASVAAQVEGAGEQGVFSNRLRFWDQTLDIALAHPLGAGNGSYQAVIHSYQKYPMTWSNSPHNYFVETAATGGWLRLALLLALILWPLWRAWRSWHWPWALAAGGVWTTLAFDVTSYYPNFMMYAFLVLGATHFAVEGDRINSERVTAYSRPQLFAGVLSLAAAAGLALWWYLPCDGASCVTARYLGLEAKARPVLQTAAEAERQQILTRLRELYPESIWVLRAEQEYATTDEQRLALAREIATRFPYQHPQNYLDWAEAAEALDRPGEVAEALTLGLHYFPEDQYPYGEQRMTPERYRAWIEEAQALLAQVSERP